MANYRPNALNSSWVQLHNNVWDQYVPPSRPTQIYPKENLALIMLNRFKTNFKISRIASILIPDMDTSSVHAWTRLPRQGKFLKKIHSMKLQKLLL